VPSKYLKTISFIHTTTLFPDNYPLRMTVTSTLGRWTVLRNILWTDESCFTLEDVLTFVSHLWPRDNPRAIRERGYQVGFSVNVLNGIVGNIVVRPYLLPDWLTNQRRRDFLETILPGLLKDVLIAVRQRLRFKHDGAPAHYGEDVRQRLNPR
jgi:hypothetical protein